MKIALVTSSYLPNRGGLERHVHELAHGLARRGVEVELLAQGDGQRARLLRERRPDGVTVRHFARGAGHVRFAVAPALAERLRALAASCELVDVHSTDSRLALVASRSGFRCRVFSPHAPLVRLVSWPQARASAAVLTAASAIVCRSSFERELLCGRFPAITDRTAVVPLGVDAAAIRTAAPFPSSAGVVLAVGALERAKRIDRGIAAIASVDPRLRLVVLGDGRLRHRLSAHAADLGVSSRVHLLGAVPDLELYRWLRSARVVLALHDGHGSGVHVTEALAAGAPVIASDTPIHREATARFDRASVRYVSPYGSPFEVADAITELACRGAAGGELASGGAPSPEAVADRVWQLYAHVLDGARPSLQPASDAPLALAGEPRLIREGWGLG